MRRPNIPSLLRFTLYLNIVQLTFARLRDSLVCANLIFPTSLGLHIF